MKLNLEIDIDWIDDESTIDDTVKQEVISSIIAKVGDSVKAQTEAKINSMIDEMVVSKINEKVDEVYADFMKREVCINDGFGSTIQTFPNVEAVVKDRFDKFLTEMVNKEGKPAGSYDSNKKPRMDYIVSSQLKQFAEKFTTDAVKKVSAEIQSHVKEGLTAKLGSELMKVLKVNEMLKIEG